MSESKKFTIKFSTYYEVIKLIVFLTVIITMGVGAFKLYTWFDAKFKAEQIQSQLALEEARKYKEYAENLARANTEIVNSLKDEISKLKKENSAAINAMLEEIDKKDERISNMGETIAKLNDNIVDLRVKSDHTYKQGTGDYNEQYFKKVMYRSKNESGLELEVPIAWAIYYPNREPSKQWKTGVYPLEYHSRIVQTEQIDGQMNTYTQVWFENNKDKASRGLQIPIDITSSEFKQERIKSERFYWWAPHVNLNMDLGISPSDGVTAGGGISFSTSGYGRTKNDLTWRFIDVGLSTDGDSVWGKFTPFTYNIGRHLPLIENTFIGPFIGYDFGTGGTSIGIGISIPF